MFDLAALDVVIGLAFLYFILSLICSALNEFVATSLGWRAKTLREGIENLLSGTYRRTAAGAELAERVYNHPLIQGLVRPNSRHGPSYIPSRTFVATLLSLGEEAGGTAAKPRPVRESIEAVPSPEIRGSLTALLQQAQGDAERFGAKAEEWFDDAMERVSGWYRRKVQIALAVLSALLVIALNADSIRIAENLWGDQAVRRAVVTAAGSEAQAQREQPSSVGEVAKTVDELEELKIPLGWNFGDDPTPETKDPQRLVWPWHDWSWFFAKLLGLLLTATALTLGAPFWFDVLSKVARLRGTGAPPPTTDAVRKGEGEETRAGSTASAAPEEPHD